MNSSPCPCSGNIALMLWWKLTLFKTNPSQFDKWRGKKILFLCPIDFYSHFVSESLFWPGHVWSDRVHFSIPVILLANLLKHWYPLKGKQDLLSLLFIAAAECKVWFIFQSECSTLLRTSLWRCPRWSPKGNGYVQMLRRRESYIGGFGSRAIIHHLCMVYVAMTSEKIM